MNNSYSDYLSIFEHLPNPVLLLGENFQVSAFNKAASSLCHKLWGVTANHHPTKLTRWLETELTDFAVASQDEIGFDKSLETPNYTYWFEVKLKRVNYSGEQLPSIMIHLNDISDRIVSAEALRQSEERFRLISENCADLIAVVDLKGYRVYNSPSYGNMLGYSPEELKGTWAYSNIHPDDQSFVLEAAQTTLKTGIGQILEYRIQHRDGSWRILESSGSVIRNERGEVQSLVIVSHDITAKKQAESALQLSTMRLRRQQQALIELTKKKTIYNGELKTILQTIAETAARTLEIERVSIWLYKENREKIYSLDLYQLSNNQHSSGLEMLRTSQTVENESTASTYLVENLELTDAVKSPTAIAFYPMVPGYSITEMIGKIATNSSSLDVPFRLGGSTAGIVLYEHVGTSREWALEEQNFAHSIADMVSLTMEQWERRRTESELLKSKARFKELVQREELLNRRLASQIRDSLDLNTILATSVSEICELLQVDLCNFFWYLPDTFPPQFELVHLASSECLPVHIDYYPLKDLPNLGLRILDLQTIRTDYISEDCELDDDSRTLLNSLGFTSHLLIPIKTRSGKLGVVVIAHCSGKRTWSEDELELLDTVSDQLAIAIDQAELYELTRADAARAYAQTVQLEEALQNLQQTQAQLIQTEKMSSLGQLVAGVAHEINNPVNFIHGNITYANRYIQNLFDVLKLYQQFYPDPPSEIQSQTQEVDLGFVLEDLPRILNSMKIGADRIRQIVMSLRNFSRTDQDEKQFFNIHEGIDSTLLILQNRLKSYAEYPSIKVIKEYGDLPLVNCYVGQLNQVFMNILSNAIDALEEYNRDRSVAEVQSRPNIVKICTYLINDSYGERVIIRISDNGLGIKSGSEAKLFDPFFTTKPIGQGTGLGLSISYQIIVEKHQGKLHCLSKPDQGAEFVIELPVK